MPNAINQNKKMMHCCFLTAKKIIFLFATLIAASANDNYAQNTWTRKADFLGGARNQAAGFTIGNKGYIGTGSGDVDKKDFWEYDPATNTWTQKADFGGTPRYGSAGFSIGSKGYLGTGYAGGYTKDFWEYDPAANKWTRKADFGGDARWVAAGFSIGSKGYIGTGEACCPTYYKDFWEYDPATNTWTQKADFGGIARRGAVVFNIGSKGYIGTGRDVNYVQTKDFWEYDPAINAWTRKADLPGNGLEGARGFSIGSKGYLGTGFPFNNDFWEYDPATNTWARKADFPGTGRFGPVVFSIGGKGYVGTGGAQSGNQKDFWEYTPPCLTGYTVYADADGDGYGDVNKSKINPTCDLLAGYVANSTDCNDADASIHPKATEKCNGIDDNCNAAVDEILGLSTTNVKATTATFNWRLMPGARKYIVKYKRIDPADTSWLFAGATARVISITVARLAPNSKYMWKIKSDCGDFNTSLSGPVRFTTAAALTAGQQNDASVTATVKELSVYPNPTSGNVTVNLTLTGQQSVSIRVFDIIGKEVYASNEGIRSGTFTKQLALDKLNPGVYFLKVKHNSETEMRKIVLMK